MRGDVPQVHRHANIPFSPFHHLQKSIAEWTKPEVLQLFAHCSQVPRSAAVFRNRHQKVTWRRERDGVYP